MNTFIYTQVRLLAPNAADVDGSSAPISCLLML